MSGYTTLYFDTRKEGIIDITKEVRSVVDSSGVKDGVCIIFSMHTTAGITINENADPDVKIDMLIGLEKAFPVRDEYRHAEGNSHAHLRTTCVGPSQTIIVSEGEMVLGQWQGIYLCEFDGPRTRKVLVKVFEC